MKAGTTKNSNYHEIISTWMEAIILLLRQIKEQSSEELVDMMLKADKIFIAGQGRSGLIGRCLATRLTQMGFHVHIPGHATCQKIEAGDLLIAISCRGTTMTTVEFARISRQIGAKVAAITAFDNSTMAKLADKVIVIDANDKNIRKKCKYIAGPSNNTLFEQAALLYVDALIHILLERKGISTNIINQQHANLE
ncbi:MAG: 6-phospho-3-hexuloisomerase [Sedimentisphaerales bacterium]